jgi:DNA polymerase III delta prime subunit
VISTETVKGLWCEKYRPQTVADCILPSETHDLFLQMAERGEPQNLLLSGGAGCGKTSIARALCNDLGCDYIVVNCSEDGNIDTLRTRIRNFASTVSLTEGVKKVVILDEFDYSNAQSTQPALRGFIEEFSTNCRFILTCNFKNRIIEPLHSRCTCIDFRIQQKEKAQIAVKFLKRATEILEAEGIEYEPKVVAQLITKYFPDFRRTLNELQRYSVSGKIDLGILQTLGDVQIRDLVKHMKAKEFANVRRWVVDNLDNDQTRVYRAIYDSLCDTVEGGSIPQAILILADYQYKAAFAADHEINLTACLVQLMMEIKFK